MKIKKSIIALILTTVVGVSVVGCGKEEKKASTNNDTKTEATTAKDDTKKEEKKDESKPAEQAATPAPTTGTTAAPATTTTTTTAPQATTTAPQTTAQAPATTTGAPSTPAQKLDALVKGLNGTARNATANECKFAALPNGSKVINYNGKIILVGAFNEASFSPAQKAQAEQIKKSKNMNIAGMTIGAYYNAGIMAICGGNPVAPTMDSAAVKIMDTFK